MRGAEWGVGNEKPQERHCGPAFAEGYGGQGGRLSAERGVRSGERTADDKKGGGPSAERETRNAERTAKAKIALC